MRLRALLPLIVLVVAAPAAAQETQTFRSEFGYSLDLPVHWTRVSDQALDVVRRSSAMAARGAVYEAGYQVADAPWPAPPMVTVASQRLPRKVTLEEFAAEFSPEAREEAQKALDEMTDDEISMGVPRWDARNRIGWVRIAMGPEGGAPTVALSVTMLHPARDYAIFLLYYGVQREDEARIRAHVVAIARSLRAN
jgi:hypothetical protein